MSRSHLIRSILARFAIVGLALAAFLLANSARADYWELSSGFNYSRSQYSGGSYSWNRKLGGSVGYNFSDSSSLELGYQRSYERDHYEGFEDSVYEDQVYSLNVVTNLASKQAIVQPYFKLGVGQLIRRASITDSLGRSQVQALSQVTAVVGAGMRIYLTKTFAIRIEGTSYLPKAEVKNWQDNFGFTFGASLYL